MKPTHVIALTQFEIDRLRDALAYAIAFGPQANVQEWIDAITTLLSQLPDPPDCPY